MGEMQKVHHIVSGGLKHGKYYRVYVTQVNKNNVESLKSIPSLIRIGDVQAPPAPTLSLDESKYKNGCHLEGSSCDVYMKWNRVECDDLDHYTLYIWKNRPDWFIGNKSYNKEYSDTASTSCYVGSAETSFSIGGQRPGSVVYVGIQSVDLSHNVSDIYILRIVVEDQSVIGKPTNPINAAPYGIWAIRVRTVCPNSTEIASVDIYRDGVTKVGSLLFHSGLEVSFVDTLDIDVGLNHYYRYRYVYTDGRVSPFSDPSISVSAKVIDHRYLDKVDMEAMMDAWINNNDVKEIENLRKTTEANIKATADMARQLATATEKYEGMFKEYKLMVQNYEAVSAKVISQEKTIQALKTQVQQNAEDITLRASKSDLDKLSEKVVKSVDSQLKVQGDKIESTVTQLATTKQALDKFEKEQKEAVEALRTSINQNATAITLRATKSEIDSATSQVKQQLVSQIQTQADRITTLVSNQNGFKSQITQLDGAIRACVTQKDMSATIALAVQQGISTAVIEADRVVVKGQILLQGNARLVGRLSANYVSLVDANGRVIWGSDVGTVQPYKETFTKNETWSSYKNVGQGQWQVLISVPFTPKPPINFNGMSRVHATIFLQIGIYTGGGFDYQTAPNMFSLQFADSVTGQNHNTGAAPTTEFDNRGCLILQTKNNVTSYVPYGGGWRRGMHMNSGNYDNNIWYTYAKVTYTGSVPIGNQMWFYLYARETPGNKQKYSSYYMSALNIQWECV